MKVATIVASNGLIEKELLQVASYTTGSISNVSSINFVEGESVELLFERYRTTLRDLDVQHGVLFLIESKSSAHEYAASYFSLQYPVSKIVTGINLPMLLSLFISENNETNPHILASKAQKYGKQAVCVLPDTEERLSTPYAI